MYRFLYAAQKRTEELNTPFRISRIVRAIPTKSKEFGVVESKKLVLRRNFAGEKREIIIYCMLLSLLSHNKR